MILPCPPCPDCGARVRVEYDTHLRSHGRCVETVLDACEHERKRRGVCRFCWRPVGGKVGMAIYCERHRREATRANHRRASAKKYARNPEKQRARVQRYRERDPEKHRERRRRWYRNEQAKRQQRAEQKRKAA
jgi:hypothetical protein